jgi:O-antigen/teichoic acid export membrane protein
MVVSVGYCLAGSAVSAKLPFFSRDVVHVLFFGALLTAMALNSLTDSVFIARRRAQYHTIAYTVFGSVRLILALALVSAGAFGIFLAYTAAGTVALLLSLRYMETGCDYRLLTRPTFGFVGQTYTFATNNYFGLLLAGLPAQVVPSLILAKLGGSATAYFAMAINIANMLYIVPMAIEQSLLAEGSNEEARAGRDSWRATKILFAVVTPLVLITLVGAPYVLRIFGSRYARGSAPVLQLLALCTIFVGITALGTSMLNVQKRTGWITLIQGGTAVITLAGVYLLLPRGLVGVGFAFLGGAVFAAAAHIAVQVTYSPKRRGRHSGSARMRSVELAGSERR